MTDFEETFLIFLIMISICLAIAGVILAGMANSTAYAECGDFGCDCSCDCVSDHESHRDHHQHKSSWVGGSGGMVYTGTNWILIP